MVYFDPFLPARMNGLEALTAYYEGIRGKIFAERFEIIEPIVTYIATLPVLTFNFISYAGSEGARMRWNCTEVYRRSAGKWSIIQTHWSLTQDGR